VLLSGFFSESVDEEDGRERRSVVRDVETELAVTVVGFVSDRTDTVIIIIIITSTASLQYYWVCWGFTIRRHHRRPRDRPTHFNCTFTCLLL